MFYIRSSCDIFKACHLLELLKHFNIYLKYNLQEDTINLEKTFLTYSQGESLVLELPEKISPNFH